MNPMIPFSRAPAKPLGSMLPVTSKAQPKGKEAIQNGPSVGPVRTSPVRMSVGVIGWPENGPGRKAASCRSPIP